MRIRGHDSRQHPDKNYEVGAAVCTCSRITNTDYVLTGSSGAASVAQASADATSCGPTCLLLAQDGFSGAYSCSHLPFLLLFGIQAIEQMVQDRRGRETSAFVHKVKAYAILLKAPATAIGPPVDETFGFVSSQFHHQRPLCCPLLFRLGLLPFRTWPRGDHISVDVRLGPGLITTLGLTASLDEFESNIMHPLTS